MLAVGAGRGFYIFFRSSVIYHSASLWEVVRYTLRYCPEKPICSKQPTWWSSLIWIRTVCSDIIAQQLKYLYGKYHIERAPNTQLAVSVALNSR